jgi:hypothetical protein
MSSGVGWGEVGGVGGSCDKKVGDRMSERMSERVKNEGVKEKEIVWYICHTHALAHKQERERERRSIEYVHTLTHKREHTRAHTA